MTAKTQNRVVAFALSAIIILLLVVVLSLLLLILWKSELPSINETTAHLNQNVTMTYLNGQTRFDTQPQMMISQKTEFNQQDIADSSEDKIHKYERNTNNIWGMWRDEILTDSEGDLEYIEPLKVSRNSYEVSTLDRNHTGHFRHGLTKFWDPYPRYEFEAFGKKFRLRFTHDSHFLAENIKFVQAVLNETKVKTFDHHLDCLYTGVVDGDPKSIVSVSLCHGMTGHLKTSTENYLIKPTEQWSNNETSFDSPLQHVILRIRKSTPKSTNVKHSEDFSSMEHKCGVFEDEHSSDEYTQPFTKYYFDKSDNAKANKPKEARRSQVKRTTRDLRSNLNDDVGFNAKNNRTKSLEDQDEDDNSGLRLRRSVPSREYFVEVMVTADSSMVKFHGSGLYAYILVLMKTVSRTFKDHTIGNPINIALVKVVTTDQLFGEPYSKKDVNNMLNQFCLWQNYHNSSDSTDEHYDVALLLTRETLCLDPRDTYCNTLGLAPIAGACKSGMSCTVVQDNGLQSAFTIAHELGHLLNMPHDEVKDCDLFRKSDEILGVMAKRMDNQMFPWIWSTCSRVVSTKFLESKYANCLLNRPKTSKIPIVNDILAGENYTADDQCKLIYGPQARLCDNIEHHNVCQQLPCSYYRDGSCFYNMPMADGTDCGNGKWCYRSECVARKYLQPVHGQWSNWSTFGACSRTCGGGIRSRIRECNSPAPRHGGNYCVGEKIQYESCATHDCPLGTPDFREEQCSKYQRNNPNVQPKKIYSPIPLSDQCKLYCKVENNRYNLYEQKVIDGTRCWEDSFDVCINGKCRAAGCDHVLDSTAKLDSCAVCRGDNSTCERHVGSYNISQYGYQRVTNIPAGSFYIDVRQYGWNGSANDSNHLVLRIGENGKYLINGNYQLIYRKVIDIPGLKIEYNGFKSVVERLNSTKPIKVDLVVELLSGGDLLPPQIEYEYSIPKDVFSGFNWVLSDWSKCDRACQGTKYRKAQCKRIKNEQIVSDDYCRNIQKPAKEIQRCNDHCDLQWQVAHVSECTGNCGPGIQKIKYNCVKILHDNSISQRMPHHLCSHLADMPAEQKCNGSCKDVRWSYGEWSACTVTCGGGSQTRKAVCVSDSNREILSDDKCDSEKKLVSRPCNQDSCPRWNYAGWTQCSVTCGQGWRERAYRCQIDNRVVPESECNEVSLTTKEACNAGPCEKWHSGEWSDCSVTCGKGVQNRKVVCRTLDNSYSSFCNATLKPIETKSCFLAPCSDPTVTLQVTNNNSPSENNDIDSNLITPHKNEFEWIITEHGDCTKSCGGGVINRIVKCSSIITKKIHPSQYCDESLRPSTMVPCNSHPCPKWDTSHWSQCSVKCGEGHQVRLVQCRSHKGEELKDTDCLMKPKPKERRQCHRQYCGSDRLHKWFTSEWSECSATCGNGVRIRNVTCHRTNIYGWKDPKFSVECPDANRPSEIHRCKIRDCNGMYFWGKGEWEKCSHTCGKKGRQVRKLFCQDSLGKKVPRLNCSKDTKPKRKRKCNQKPCGVATCLDLKQRFPSAKDGEHSLVVGNQIMSIYCHGMNTDYPKEYLTLPASSQQNYAEFYDKRLSDPRTCPYSGKRNDSCDCSKIRESDYGKTVFNKIRVDVIDLYIIANDYTFATTTGGRTVEFGTAGDCYSMQNCPQGLFSINLSGTFFHIAPQVTWTTQNRRAYHSVTRLSNQNIVGRCGGYCGACLPSTGLKLNVIST